MKEFVAWGLISSVIVGIIGIVFSYNIEFSDAMFTLAGMGLYVFGIWAAKILLRK